MNVKHGYTSRENIDGLYYTWRGMKKRCSHHPRYKAKGIKVCQEWVGDYAEFREWAINNGWEKGLTIERKDNDGPYTPRNCCFATRAVQNRNKGDTRKISFGGKELCLAEWAKEKGIKKTTLIRRFELGWSVQKALTMPVRAKICG